VARKRGQLEVDGHVVELTSLDKVLYPGGNFRKADVIDFYVHVADVLLPHLRGRPVTLKRYPEGVLEEHFYEKDAPAFTPDWVRTVPVSRRAGGPPIRYIVIDDRATLVWLANLANLEIHPFLHCAADTERPTSIVFDLDPGEGADVVTCARVALLLRDLLDGLGLTSFAKVSGSKGIQVFVPLNRDVSYAVTGAFAKAVARLMEEQHPDLVVSEMPVALRASKVFVDWSQNSDFKTTVSVYSLRANAPVAFVSMPVEWDELGEAIRREDKTRLFFTPGAARRRLDKLGDLFAPVLTMEQSLPAEVARAFRKRKTPAPELTVYENKRDFRKTSEPRPGSPRKSRQGSRRRFVVQKHAASHLHYDFRLEMHGALKSWAVPKGPPFAHDEARLARATEDHPLEYLDFEGIIPKGQYGGGTVMVWDIGNWELVEGNYYKGFLRFHLEGEKLHGEWVLRAEKEKDGSWRLVRSGSTAESELAGADDRSALTGRTMDEIAEAADAVWQSNREESSRRAKKPSRAARR
jgi:bifunctional non-homologous end joining protein LigD